MNVDLEAAGAAATAALAAHEIDSGKHAAKGEHTGACANCAAPLAGAYCHACGQSAHVHRSLWHMLEEGLHGVLHFDTKSWRTLPLLIARPGLLTRRYILGQRARYVSPLALFLFTVFLMFFGVSQLSKPLANFKLSSAPVGELKRAGITTRATVEEAVQTAVKARVPAVPGNSQQPAASAATPGEDTINVNLVLPRFPDDASTGNRKLDDALRNPELTFYKIKNTAYKFSFMLIPISLPFLWLMFCRRRDVFVYDHMVFAMYSLSFMSLWFLMIAFMSAWPATSAWIGAACVLPPLHMFLHLRETYVLGPWGTLWRTGVLLTIAGAVFLAFLLGVVLISVPLK